VIRASGPDARSFLHSQLTQDVQGLPAGTATLAGYCSAKGRLLATFIVWSEAADEVLLACSADLLPATLRRLSMFVLRAKCKLSDASGQVLLWGLAGAEADAFLGPARPTRDWQTATATNGLAIRLPSARIEATLKSRYLFAAPNGDGIAAVVPLDPGAWRSLEVHSGVARVVAATVEQFVPQMLNLELVGGVSFSKGCYPGQEIVARSQYRGTLKRRAFVVEGSESIAPGLEIFHSSDPGQPAGMVVLSGSWGDGRHPALVELKLSALDVGELHAGSPAGSALQLRDLPYAIPANA
jgi:folate-binding protein YgfZ